MMGTWKGNGLMSTLCDSPRDKSDTFTMFMYPGAINARGKKLVSSTNPLLICGFVSARPWGGTITLGAVFLGSLGDLIVGTC